jgi:D-alanyl-D-alanine carboxypeptidase (penicillin-binding protein 5/6)
MGFDVRTNTRVERIVRIDDGVRVHAQNGAGEAVTFDAEKALVAVGVQPNVEDLGLEAVGVKTRKGGFVEVDQFMRTSVPTIYAVGDVTGKLMLAHVASAMGMIAAEHIAGSEPTFAELMNTHAERLGMTNSHFMNSDGLPHPDHFSTARDMALVTEATIREFPEYYAWYSEKEFVWNDIMQPNRNLLLNRDPSVDGVKTGHTEAAGYCLVASAKRDGTRLTSVVMGAEGVESRAQASLALLNYGFRFFESHQLYPGGQPVETLRVYKGESKELPVGPAEDLWVSTPRRQYDKLSAHLEKRPDLQAPIAQGEAVGEIVVSLEGKDLRRVPLVALKEVPAGGIWAKVRDGVLQWF